MTGWLSQYQKPVTDEKPHLANRTARNIVYSTWRPFWNLTKPALIEKSPMHCVMTRLLQYYFTPERSHFVITFKHPLSFVEVDLGNSSLTWDKCGFRCECGREHLKAWLHVMGLIVKDIGFLRHGTIIQSERFALENTQGLCKV